MTGYQSLFSSPGVFNSEPPLSRGAPAMKARKALWSLLALGEPDGTPRPANSEVEQLQVGGKWFHSLSCWLGGISDALKIKTLRSSIPWASGSTSIVVTPRGCLSRT